MEMYLAKKGENTGEGTPIPDTGPIDAGGQKMTKPSIIRWAVLVFIIIYMLLAYFHTPILTRIGRYLVVAHPAEKSDLIVCLKGANVENGMAAAEAYNKELAPRIFLTRARLPDGAAQLREKGLSYPEERDLLVTLLKGLGVPDSALIISNQYVENLFDEAELVRKMVEERGFRTLILITSPTHSRRAWLTFRRIFRERKDVRIFVIPSPYSNFKPENWWQKGWYSREVISEYMKLIYNSPKYF